MPWTTAATGIQPNTTDFRGGMINDIFRATKHRRLARAMTAAWLKGRQTERPPAEIVPYLQERQLDGFQAKTVATAVPAGNDRMDLGHRGEIAAIFVDLRGYTRFSVHAEPEDVTAMLAGFFSTVGRLADRHGATFSQASGDRAFLFVGDPVACPDLARTAASLAVDIRAALTDFVQPWLAQGKCLGFGIGLAQGFVSLGWFGYRQCMVYTAIGNIVNLAARLCDDAKDSQVLVAGRLAVDMAPVADLERLGAVEPKGWPQSIVVHNLIRLKD